MSTSIDFRRLLGGLACAVTLGACSTAPVANVARTNTAPVANVALTNQDVMAKAVSASNAGQKDAAMALWKQAATIVPADKEPWARMAQAKYDAGQYGEAIMDAQEVLLRDPLDKLANSIVAISGLRLSTRALAELSRQNNLSGSLRTESQDLAKLLRESLGENVLVPPAHPTKTQVLVRPIVKRKLDANPFGGLK